MSCLHTLRVLGSVRKREELLLELRGHVNAGEMSTMGSNTDLVARSRIAQEDTLLRWVLGGLWMNTRETAGVAASSVDRKRAIDISASLVELDRLPGVLRGLADARTLRNAVIRVRLVRLGLLVLYVTLDLVLPEAQWQIELKRSLVILARLGLLKARLV